MLKPEITQALVKEFLNYDSDTGLFTWRNRSRRWFKSDRDHKAWNTLYAGKRTGSVRKCNGKKYTVIAIFGKNYYSHRLAFIYVTGYMPDFVDHKNGNGLDNRWRNLRKSTVIENAKNMKLPADNKSGVIGVVKCKRSGKWRSVIVINQKQKHLGLFDTIEEAKIARKKAEVENVFYKNHGSNRPL